MAIINGTPGNDTLDGTTADDTINGGTGDDVLSGHEGSDTYVVGFNSGHDTISPSYESFQETNVIQLEANVTLSDLRFTRSTGLDLEIHIGTSSSVYIPAQHPYGLISVDHVLFSDGTSFDVRGSIYSVGTDGNDILHSRLGGKDTIEGGKGDDLIYGANDGGDTTFIIGKNDGNDTIQGDYGKIILKDGISVDDLRFVFNSYHTLKIFIDETSSVQFSYDPYQGRSTSVLLEDGTPVSIHTLTGTQGNDDLSTSDYDSTFPYILKGLGGNDTLSGNFGDNILIGGTGNDSMNGIYGNDTYIIGYNEGNDTISTDYNYQSSIIQFGEGIHPEDLTFARTPFYNYAYDLKISIGNLSSVTIQAIENDNPLIPLLHFADGTIVDLHSYFPNHGTEAADHMNGTDFNDLFTGLGGDDTITGAKGNDTLDGGEGNDSLNGGFNNDSLLGGNGNDTLLGGDQDDTLQGDAGNDFLNGQGGKDMLFGGEGNDTLLGDGFNDTLYGGNGDDSLDGGQQDDLLYGGAGNDTLEGYVGNDTLYGEDGNDLIRGNRGADSIDAGAGDDTINGGIGGDTLTGGAGADMFIYAATSDSFNKIAGGIDTITDFEHGVDHLILTGLHFTGLDTDGGPTEKGELRLVYDAASNLTHIHSDQTGFDVALIGNYAGVITNNDFVF